MRQKNLVLASVMACLAVLALSWPVAAFPPLPSSFYGTVKVNGQNVPDGTLVVARIGDRVYAQSRTQTYQGDSVYSLDVPGDDAGTAEIEGGIAGDVVLFEVAGSLASQTGRWASGTNVALNLTAVLSGPLPLPPPTLLPLPTTTTTDSPIKQMTPTVGASQPPEAVKVAATSTTVGGAEMALAAQPTQSTADVAPVHTPTAGVADSSAATPPPVRPTDTLAIATAAPAAVPELAQTSVPPDAAPAEETVDSQTPEMERPASGGRPTRLAGASSEATPEVALTESASSTQSDMVSRDRDGGGLVLGVLAMFAVAIGLVWLVIRRRG